MTALIEIRDLSISANGKQILKNINLDINEGDSIGIIGKSGAGKVLFYICFEVLRNLKILSARSFLIFPPVPNAVK